MREEVTPDRLRRSRVTGRPWASSTTSILAPISTWCGPRFPRYDRLQVLIADAASEVGARDILDLGTGTGETLRHVQSRHPDARLVGIDESDAMLAVARAAVPAADLHVARLQDPLPLGRFDLVVSALAVHHLDAAEKADLFARVAARLRAGRSLRAG